MVAELVLRRSFTFDTGTTAEHLIPHPKYGWILEPGASYANQMPETTVRVTYNTEGWRDLERSFENPQGKLRVLVLGDSFMEGYSVDLEDAFHRHLERLLRGRNIDVEVINLGVGGYGTLQEYLVYHDVGRRYRPDLVLLGFLTFNDLRNNSLELETISMGAERVKARPYLDPAAAPDWRITDVDFEGAQTRYAEAKSSQNTLMRRLKRRSALWRTLTAEKPYWRKVPLPTRESHANRAAWERKYLSWFGMHFCQERPEITRAWDITERIFGRLNREIEAAGSKLIVFSVPTLTLLDTAEMRAVEQGAPDTIELCLEEAPANVRLQNLMHELDIEYVELLQVFRGAVRDGTNDPFRRSDRHWNEVGQTLAAETVAAFLMEKNLLPTSQTTP